MGLELAQSIGFGELRAQSELRQRRLACDAQLPAWRGIRHFLAGC